MRCSVSVVAAAAAAVATKTICASIRQQVSESRNSKAAIECDFSQIYQKADAFVRATHWFIVLADLLFRQDVHRRHVTLEQLNRVCVCSHMFFGLIWRRVAVFFAAIALL